MSDYSNLSLGDRMLVDSYTKPIHREIEQLRAQLAALQATPAHKRIRELETQLAEMTAKYNFMVDSAQQNGRERDAALAKLDCAVEALENCTGGDLASGEGIYKAEIAREALANLRKEASKGEASALERERKAFYAGYEWKGLMDGTALSMPDLEKAAQDWCHKASCP